MLEDKLIIPINPNAGNVFPSVISRVKAKESDKVKVVVSSDRNDLYDMIVDQKFSHVFPLGGDGTIVDHYNEIKSRAEDINQAIPTFIFGKIAGSGRALAEFVGAKRGYGQLEKITALERFSSLPTLEFPMMEVFLDNQDKSTYSFCAGIGLDASVLRKYNEGKIKGLLGYLIATFKTALKDNTVQLPQAIVTCNKGRVVEIEKNEMVTDRHLKPGETIFEGPIATIIAGTTRYFGYEMKALPYANIASIEPTGLMHARIITGNDRGQILRHLAFHPYSIFHGTFRSDNVKEILAHDITIKIKNERGEETQVAGDYEGFHKKIKFSFSKDKMQVVDMRKIYVPGLI